MPSQAPGRHRLISGPLRCAIRAKTVAAQNRPARRRLEGHGISLAALVARDLESLAFTTWLCSSATAEVGPPRIATRLTAFWMSKIRSEERRVGKEWTARRSPAAPPTAQRT